MAIQLALRTADGSPIVSFHDSVDAALQAAWQAQHDDPPATPINISEGSTLIYQTAEIQAVTALYASVHDWPKGS